MPTATRQLRERIANCRELAEFLYASRQRPVVRSLLRSAEAEIPAAALPHRDDRILADALAQTLVAARDAWSRATNLHTVPDPDHLFPPSDSLLGRVVRLAAGSTAGLAGRTRRVDSTLRELLSMLACFNLSRPAPAQSIEDPGFDVFLGSHDPGSRTRHGVFFTPQRLASFIVSEIDRLLRGEFRLPAGLADTATWSSMRGGESSGESIDSTVANKDQRPFVQILDPAAGTGVFLVEIVARVHESWNQQLAADEWTAADRDAAWNEFVAEHLLPRLNARELLLPACAVAWIQVARQLAATGYRFGSAQLQPLKLGDSLAGPDRDLGAVTVVVGNPPFSALTTSGNAWIHGLLRDREWQGRTVGSYYEVDGARLNEKKLWLHDDYVKFLRYAQWLIESSGWGIVGFVTNHGYLDNVTFRGVRKSLLTSFPRLSVLDLHGNRKKREETREAVPDENVFGIDQGVAVGLFRRPPESLPADPLRCDLWGTRRDKLAALRDPSALKWRSFAPSAPYYLLEMPRPQGGSPDEYAQGFAINEVMPVHSSAAVTARDGFAIAFTPEELAERLRFLSDPAVTDDELRQRYFFRTRSRRYPAGDTRGWKLPAARAALRSVANPELLIRRCLYRPFDWRWVLWANWIIDWPRTSVMGHMLAENNVALITRRQMLPNQPATYFFIADSIVIDGLIRSDNRGSESFFPLYVGDYDEAKKRPVTANFSRQFAHACQSFAPHGHVVPEDLLAVIYAQFHSPGYRARYQSELCREFPRVFIPRTQALFRQLAERGKELIDCHLLRPPFQSADGHRVPDSERVMPHRGWPRHADDILAACDGWKLGPVSSDTWRFPIGGYQVCRKWLRDRAGRKLTVPEMQQYSRILPAIAATVRIMREIDAAIAAEGGWPGAFVGRNAGNC